MRSGTGVKIDLSLEVARDVGIPRRVCDDAEGAFVTAVCVADPLVPYGGTRGAELANLGIGVYLRAIGSSLDGVPGRKDVAGRVDGHAFDILLARAPESGRPKKRAAGIEVDREGIVIAGGASEITAGVHI